MPWLLGILVQAGMWIFRSRIGFILAAGLAWLGINLVTFRVVLDPAIDMLDSVMATMASGGPPGSAGPAAAAMWSWFLVLQFPGALQMVVSAIVTRMGVKAGLIAIAKAGG